MSCVHFQAKTCHSYHLSTCMAPWNPQVFGHTMVQWYTMKDLHQWLTADAVLVRLRLIFVVEHANCLVQ